MDRRFRLASDSTQWFTVVGVAADIQDNFVSEAIQPAVYLPLPYRVGPRAAVLVRTAREPAAIAADVRKATRVAVPAAPVIEALPFAALRDRAYEMERLLLRLFTIVGMIALVIAAFGLYAVVSFVVGLGARDICVRLAIGARPGHIVRQILQRAVLTTIGGTVLGAFGALWLVRVVPSMGSGAAAAGPVTFALAGCFLLLVALAAALVPAFRAVKISPAAVLRAD